MMKGIDGDKLQALKRALADFNRFGLDHSEDCPHRTYCDAPCPGGDNCDETEGMSPCDPYECWAAAAVNLYDSASELLTAIEAA